MPRGTPNLCRRFIRRIVVPGTCPLGPPCRPPLCGINSEHVSKYESMPPLDLDHSSLPSVCHKYKGTKRMSSAHRAERPYIAGGHTMGRGWSDRPPLPAETHKAHTALISVLGAIRCNRLRYVLYCVTRSLCETDSTELLYHNVLRSQKVISKINSELSKYYFGRGFFPEQKLNS